MTTIATLQTITRTLNQTPAPRRKTPLLRRALNWYAERNALYRQAQKLRAMPDDRLDDMGITREQVERLF